MSKCFSLVTFEVAKSRKKVQNSFISKTEATYGPSIFHSMLQCTQVWFRRSWDPWARFSLYIMSQFHFQSPNQDLNSFFGNCTTGIVGGMLFPCPKQTLKKGGHWRNIPFALQISKSSTSWFLVGSRVPNLKRVGRVMDPNSNSFQVGQLGKTSTF